MEFNIVRDQESSQQPFLQPVVSVWPSVSALQRLIQFISRSQSGQQHFCMCFESVLAICQHLFSAWCVLQRLQQSYGRQNPGAEIVQQYSGLVCVLLSHVIAGCSWLCQHMAFMDSIIVQQFLATPPFPPSFWNIHVYMYIWIKSA